MNEMISASFGYGPILVLLLVAAGMAGFIILASALLGPHRHGPTKHVPYESGIDPTGDARGRFKVRFFLVALLFLLFDVEVVFLWPYAPLLFRAGAGEAGVPGKQFLLVEMCVFLAILLIGYVYAWRKGAFRWD